MLVEYTVALAWADKNLKKDIPWISVSAVGMFEGCLADIQRIGLMSEVDIFRTSTGLTCVMWEVAAQLLALRNRSNFKKVDVKMVYGIRCDVTCRKTMRHRISTTE